MSRTMKETGASTEPEERARKAADQVADTARQAGADARETLESAGESLQEEASALIDEAAERAEGMIERRKSDLADEVAALSRALDTSAEGLEEEDFSTAADLTREAARKLERASSYLDRSDLGDLAADAEDVGRRDPGLFLAGALALGFAASRFLKASADRSRERRNDDERDPPGDRFGAPRVGVHRVGARAPMDPYATSTAADRRRSEW